MRLLGFLLLFLSTLSFAKLPYVPINFPRDEGGHYKDVPYEFNQLIEWWYFNGVLTTDEGETFGYNVVLFNPAMKDESVLINSILHTQLADLNKKQSNGIITFFPAGAANISTSKLDITVGQDYVLQKRKLKDKEIYLLKAKSHDEKNSLNFDLILEPQSTPLLINGNGLLSMPDNTNTYYYTIPRFKTTGTLEQNGKIFHIKNKPGDSWMDHQWGDFNVGVGWEWFSIRLENGLIANIYLIFEYNDKKVIDGLANIILPSGEKRFIPYNAFNITRNGYWLDKKLSINFPIDFTFRFPQLGLEINNKALFPEQEANGYWEGYCNVQAKYNKKKVNGFSYTEIVYRKES